MHDSHHTDAVVQTEENVRASVHDVEDLRAAHPRFDELSDREKLAVARDVEPVRVVEQRNTTVDQLHTLIAQLLDPNTSASGTASHLAVGTGTASPSSGNTSLNNEVYRTSVTDTSVNGTDLFTSTFLDTSEANGNDLEEVGLAQSGTGGASDVLNHSLVDTIEKTAETTATIDCTLSFDPA